MKARRQRSGLANTAYADRFDLTANALERALRLLGCEVCGDGTGMVYIVAKDDLRIGGPASCQEQAMYSAVRELEQQAIEAGRATG